MSEYAEAHDSMAESSENSPTPRGEVDLTGNETVDGVLRSLSDLEGTAVHEHVAVFESAHESLRAALSDAGERPSRSVGG